MDDAVVWLDGALVVAAEATVSVFDHGMTVGDGVFETLKGAAGVPFAPSRHLARLRRSAAALGLEVRYTDDEMHAAMLAVLAPHEGSVRLRVTLTGGVSPLGSDRGASGPTLVMAVGPLRVDSSPTAVTVAPWPRNERGALAGVKSTSYAENVIALAHAKERGCSEALFATTTGLLSEGTGSNVFVGVGGRLLTPPLESSGCLAGVTRALVLEVSDALEEDIPMELLARSDEVFLTSTGRDVQPVERIDDRRLPAGPLTEAAARAFADLASRTSDP